METPEAFNYSKHEKDDHPNALTEKLMPYAEEALFVIISRTPQEVRKEVTDAVADFFENCARYSNPGYQLSDTEAIDRSRELARRLREIKL